MHETSNITVKMQHTSGGDLEKQHNHLNLLTQTNVVEFWIWIFDTKTIVL